MLEQKPVNFLQNQFSGVKPTQQQKNTGSFFDLIKFALLALIIIVPIRAFVAQPFIVSGESMFPTFKDRDYLIVDELSYKLREPKRGEVIVFHPPSQPKSVYYIKRIIGLPGETVSISNNKVTIINAKEPNGFVLDEPYLQNLGGDSASVKLGTDQYFVLGDNRPRSSDSRYWGTLPRENIVGRALVRLYPFTTIDLLPGAYSFTK